MDAPQHVASPTRGPWWWVPSLYFTQAVPYVLATIVTTYAYTRLGVTAIVIGYTTWLGLPWMLKPLWSPVVELVSTERRWVWTTEMFAGLVLAFVGWGYTTDHFLGWTVLGYTLLAITSATHDIAADGYYMRVLSSHDQTWFSGIRSVAFRGGWIFVEGALVVVAGELMERKYGPGAAWAITHGVAAAALMLIGAYHSLILPHMVPRDAAEVREASRGFLADAALVFAKFFASIPVASALSFLLLYRFAEAQLTKFAGKFLLDPRSAGGLELVEQEVGFINGVFGIGALLAGGVLGGIVAARFGLRSCLLWMAVMLNVPNLAYLALAYAQPEELWLVGVGVVVEKLGYGFGFTGYMLYMLYLAQGEHRTSFYAICTGFMTLGLILPGSLAGYPLEWLGYRGFFTWVMVATIPSFLVALVIYWQLDPEFGRREATA